MGCCSSDASHPAVDTKNAVEPFVAEKEIGGAAKTEIEEKIANDPPIKQLTSHPSSDAGTGTGTGPRPTHSRNPSRSILKSEERRNSEERKHSTVSERRMSGHLQQVIPPRSQTPEGAKVLEGVVRRGSAPQLLDIGENDPKKKKKRVIRRTSHRGMISKLALQFPLIRKSFIAVHRVFETYMTKIEGPLPTPRSHRDETKEQPIQNRDGITLDKLGSVLEAVGGHTFSNEQVRALFNLADLDGSKTISFREFLICIAVGYFLAHESQNSEFIEIQRGFKVVEQAFKDMDEDGSNSVDVGELKKALFAASFDRDTTTLENRFKELDFDGDGDIYFPEFLYGFVSWVGFMDDNDEPDEDSDVEDGETKLPDQDVEKQNKKEKEKEKRPSSAKTSS